MESLTNEQLCALAQAGDAGAVETLVDKNRPYLQQLAKKLISNPVWAEQLSCWGIDQDDLIQAGSIGLWKAIGGYNSAKENKFLTYANRIIKSHISDLIQQYSRDTIWQLRTDRTKTWKIVYLDEP